MAINSIASARAWSCMMIIIQKSSIIKCIEHDQTAVIIIRDDVTPSIGTSSTTAAAVLQTSRGAYSPLKFGAWRKGL